MRLLKEIFTYWQKRLGWHKAGYALLIATAIGNVFGFLLTWLFTGQPQPAVLAMVLASVETLTGYLAISVGWEQGLYSLRHAHEK
ncbi:MAG: hypothetical protein HZA04_06225 [Nitrospinae bacterium]|nr:hypothetical protein [Nitrospinota bacterium]